MSRKIIKISLAVAAVFLLTVYLVVLFGLSPIVNTVTSKFAPEILGCDVTIDDIDVYPAFNGCSVQGIKVGNPEGFQTETAFRIDDITVQVQLTSLASDTIVVKNVIIDGARVTYEQGATTSNLFAIKNNIEKFIQKQQGAGRKEGPSEEETVEEEVSKGSKKLVIENFEFKNAKVDFSVVFMGGRSMTLPIPDIQLTDIGKSAENGATISDVVKEVYNEIFDACTNVVSGVGKSLGKAGGAVVDEAKKLGSEAKSMLKDAGSIFGFGGSKDKDEEVDK